jgi:ABC-2 type transport system ATP-binding protein
MNPRIAEVCNLHFRWPQAKVDWFQGINLRIEGGLLYGLLGRNGAGKTTLIKLICGLMKATSGEVLLSAGRDGKSVYPRSPQNLAQVVFVPETAQLPDLMPLEFSRLAGSLYPNYSQTEFQELLQGFEVKTDVRLGRLSFGQRRKVHISFALATGAALVILDEPTNGLDISAQFTLRRLLKRYLTPQRSLLVSTHHVRELEQVIDEVIVLEKGKILVQENLARLKTGPLLGGNIEEWYTNLIGLTDSFSSPERNSHA